MESFSWRGDVLKKQTLLNHMVNEDTAGEAQHLIIHDYQSLLRRLFDALE